MGTGPSAFIQILSFAGGGQQHAQTSSIKDYLWHRTSSVPPRVFRIYLSLSALSRRLSIPALAQHLSRFPLRAYSRTSDVGHAGERPYATIPVSRAYMPLIQAPYADDVRLLSSTQSICLPSLFRLSPKDYRVVHYFTLKNRCVSM